jgi:transcription elongation factor GreB
VASAPRGCHCSRVSKAFTKDDAADDPLVVPTRRPLPAGAPNYVTPRGLESLRAELQRLHDQPPAVEAPSESERAHARAIAGGRVRDLEERIASAVVVDPSAQPRDEVRFGARVTVRGESGGDRRYEIVGVDEADAAAGRVAFAAPLARALLGKRVGDAVTLRTPRGEEDLEVVAIE